MSVNPTRHLRFFDPATFNPKRIDIIGAGATGSKVAMELAKLGVTNLHIWDFDIVEDHNVANQVYGLCDVGKLKVEALKERIKRDTGVDINIHNERVTGSTPGFGEVVFLLVDSMDARREIWDGALKYQFHISLVVETRFGTTNDGGLMGRIWTLCPTNPEHVEAWEKNFYATAEAARSECGTSDSLGAMSSHLASTAVLHFIEWHKIQRGGKGELHTEVNYCPTWHQYDARQY
jgi:molybdopterin/thiamine biosynthesis adenylyltransferase